MNLALIVSMIFVVIVLVVGVILTISVANSSTMPGNKSYDSKKSFSGLLWVYVLSVPVAIIITLVAIFVFY
ncbi:hypothetical protein NCCP2331_23140 [Sporosarcina sp. NCCP-2331]|nr:hypothetical protein NCCP2331_23140 [Sporosarcina sp. NCCP-2331]GLB56231.1 hypothetical protein NCCP2378_20180 [Sporosarcina sp. NCCP-2378]